ncbi:glycerophosphodiester phosphodiesterase [Parapedobacter defluvii]|nr:glycerophosphodiester phosphodiesterase family protein [Parapedobacter defluvii]
MRKDFARKNYFRFKPVVLWVIFAACVTCLHAQIPCESPKVVAHRGKASGYPENSLSGFASMLRADIDYIEVDVRTTSDGIPVVLHDGDLKRTTNAHGKLKEYTIRSLADVWLKKKRNSPKSEHIPTLEQVCTLLSEYNSANEKSVNLYVDCKDIAPETLARILKSYDLDREAVFYGGDDYLKRLRSVLPHARIIPALRNLEDLEKKVADLAPYGFDVKWKVLDANTAKRIQSKNVKIYTDLLFISDRKKNYLSAQRWGIDAIQTNRARKAGGILTTHCRPESIARN